ncbi:ferredoxin domain-containing protein [Acetohalobium arabaticum]|uniref:DUF2148 domain-containing protein n=1 Tax=Acetohalobium arabaticum (strain ATCC 49924 / DSM 5501 / Z-7288) TaxID=574087 RepID=D9QUP2_ACEAZ|nr:DUF2148 domain-containing protein [Acetohalobium arabaticum]ADL11951.1 Protein of unknown function DUF2148 [Acetohalobium arabaticum DSM 5501]
MFLKNQEAEKEGVLQAAKLMTTAARTAPKGKGVDNLATAVLGEGEEKEELVAEMKGLADESGAGFFKRDAENIAEADAVVLLGTETGAIGVPACGYCGFEDCSAQSQSENGVCAFNTGDLGIAVGSAVSKAADLRIDNRIMFTAGKAAVRLDLLGEDVEIAYGIALNAAGKNPFFDRG